MFVLCDQGDGCQTDADCGAGAVCGDTGCSDGQGRCIELCPDRATSAQGPSDESNGEAETFEHTVVVVTCPTQPYIPEGPQGGGPASIVQTYVNDGCQADEGTTVEARGSDGQIVDRCVTSGGFCSVSIDPSDLPVTLTATGLAPGIVADDPITIGPEGATGSATTHLINISAAAESRGGQPAGDLAYSVKNGGHWDIWVYSFDTGQNTQLTSEPNSDQWAPSYSHDGSMLAYLSDQTDGSNQIWLMDPDGANQRQITDWHEAESILYIAWSPDDSQLIVTLFGDVRRLVTMPSGGGGFSPYVSGASSSFASTAPGGTLVYAVDYGDAISTSIYLGTFANPSQATAYAQGDTPNISGDAAYVLVQIGDPGSRHVESYPLSAAGSALPPPARVGDDSNPVWLTGNHDYLAFASAGPNGESIQVCQVGDVSATALAIAPHERVWYLSKRFTGARGADVGSEAVPTLEPLPANGENGSAATDTAANGANQASGGLGSIEVHVADCAPGYSGPDFFEACHDMGDGDAHWNVIITGPGDFREILNTYVESSPGPVVARIEGLTPGTYGVELMTKFVKAPAYVFCSPDQGATVLADQMLGDYHDPVQVPVNGDAVVCDWYHLYLG